MQLIYADRYYDTPEFNEGRFARELVADLESTGFEVEAHNVDIGRGADWPVVLVELFRDLDWGSLLTAAGVSGFFLGGKKLNESLDGWIQVGRKASSLFARFKPTRIDERAAVTIALSEVSEDVDVQSVSLKLHIEEFEPITLNRFRLSRRPDALYTVSIRTNHYLYIYGFLSNGERLFEHKLDTRRLESSNTK